MKNIDLVYTLAKAGYSKEEIANLMGGDTAQATTAATAAAPVATPALAAPAAAPVATPAPTAPAAAATPETTATPVAAPSDEISALRNRLRVLESVLSVSNTDNADSLASIVYPKGE